MASILIVCGAIGVSAGVYAVYEAVKAKRNQNKTSVYADKVNEYTIKRGYPLSNNYNNLEKRLENGEPLRERRNPMNNPVYRNIKELNDKLAYENQSDYQEV